MGTRFWALGCVAWCAACATTHSKTDTAPPPQPEPEWAAERGGINEATGVAFGVGSVGDVVASERTAAETKAARAAQSDLSRVIREWATAHEHDPRLAVEIAGQETSTAEHWLDDTSKTLYVMTEVDLDSLERRLGKAASAASEQATNGDALPKVSAAVPKGAAAAVLDLEAAEGVPAPLARALTGTVIDALLASQTLRVIDPATRDRVISEQGFQMGDFTGEASRVKVGRLLGARYLVVGSLSRVGNSYLVGLKAVDIESGELRATTTQKCSCSTEELVEFTRRSVAGLLASWR